MSTLKATPGPWFFEQTDAGDEQNPPTYRVFAADDSYEATICELWSGEGDTNANAHLIKASHRLYAALEALVTWLEQGDCDDAFIAPAIAALKAARGEE